MGYGHQHRPSLEVGPWTQTWFSVAACACMSPLPQGQCRLFGLVWATSLADTNIVPGGEVFVFLLQWLDPSHL